MRCVSVAAKWGVLFAVCAVIVLGVWSVALAVQDCSRYDSNGDHKITSMDLSKFSYAYGSTSGDARYNASFDANGDGFINSLDISGFSSCFGASY